jgi:hypothetical protein
MSTLPRMRSGKLDCSCIINVPTVLFARRQNPRRPPFPLLSVCAASNNLEIISRMKTTRCSLARAQGCALLALLGSRTRQNNPLNRVYPDIPRHFIDISNGVPGLSERKEGSRQPAMNRSKQTTMAVKTIVVFLVGLVLASGCVQAVLLVIVLAMSLEQT